MGTDVGWAGLQTSLTFQVRPGSAALVSLRGCNSGQFACAQVHVHLPCVYGLHGVTRLV